MARITIKGTAARDNLFAPNPYSEIYEIFGFESNDTLGGGAGGDILDGGEGFDFASYQQATAPVRVDMLNMESNTGWAAGDEFRSIEGLIGSRYDDWLRGDNNNNIIDGWAGNDTIFAEGGNDIVRDAGGYDELHGGTDGFDPSAAAHPWAQFAVGDTLEYTAKAGSKLGITADLEAGYVIEHGFRTEDKVEGFEGIRGTEYDDTIYGREQSDVVLQGGAGVDTIYGRGGNDYINGGADGDVLYGEDGEDYIHGGTGDDTIVGGRGDDDLRGAGGTDTVSYADVEFVGETSDGDFLGVLVNLTDSGFDLMPANAAAVGTPFIGPVFGTEIDALSGIENVIGTRYRDDIYGNWQDNEFDGGAGTDFLFGHEGNDTLIGGEGDFLDWLIGGDDTDELLGGDGDDILDGGSGADQLLGGDGIDTAWYNGESDDSVTLWVSLANPAINTGYAQGDSYDSVENVVGTIRRDIIYGNDDDNRLDGREGSDSLYGNGGDDTLVGDSGFPWADYFYGGTGEDTVDYSELFNPDYTGVTVDLLDQSLNAGLATNDQFYSIENIFAPAQGAGSTLSGDDALNELRGGVGGDRLMGRGSFDTLIGNGGTDTAVFRGDIDDYAIRWLYPYGRPIEERFLEVTDLAANRDGTDYVIGIEQLEFNGVVYSTSDWMII